MKIDEILKRFDKTKARPAHINYDELTRELGFYEDIDWNRTEEIETSLKSFWLQCSYDTDAFVGIKLWFLKDKFLCYSNQNGRECDERFYWHSEKTFRTCKTFIGCFMAYREDHFQVIRREEIVEEFYKLDYAGSSIDKIAFLDGREVEILSAPNMYEGEYNLHMVEIKDEEKGYKGLIDIRKLKFKTQGI